MGPLHRELRRTLLKLGGAGPLTDGELLGRFAAQQDQVAFEEIVRRHGPMVLRVCQRVLHHAQDAEDALQATFIVLARKASLIAKAESVASWLHGVAFRVSLKAKTSAGRRRVHERRAEKSAVVEDGPQEPSADEWRVVRSAMDAELGHLPDKYRAPVVLCYLEGKTNQEAAQQLGCPMGTVAYRLSRARDLLRDRLLRRGLTLPAGGIAAVLAQEAATAAAGTMPPTLLAVTVQGAAATELPPQVVALVDATLRSMAPRKLRMAAAMVVATGVLGLGATMFVRWAGAKPLDVGAPRSAPVAAPPRSVPGAIIWDPVQQVFVPIANPRSEILSAAWSADGKVLAIGFSGGVSLYDGSASAKRTAFGSEGEVVLQGLPFDVHKGLPVTRMVFSPDGRTLASLAGGERDGELALWDMRSLQMTSVIPFRGTVSYKRLPTDARPETQLAFTPGGATLIQHIERSGVHLWDVASGSQKPLALPDGCSCLSVSPDGTTLALFRERTRDILVWDLATRQERRAYRVDGNNVAFHVAVSPQGQQLALEVQTITGEVGVFLIEVGSRKGRRISGEGWSGWPGKNLEFSPDGTKLMRTGTNSAQHAQVDVGKGASGTTSVP
jgi:RNA polymerase sigma factor (sigma-70 family)